MSDDYKLQVLKVAIQHYFDELSPSSLAELQQLEQNCDLTVWKVATWIYQESGHQVDFSLVRDIIQAQIPSLKSRLLAEQKRREEVEARRLLEQQRQAEAKAEVQRFLEEKQREEAEKAHRLLEQKRQEELEVQRILEQKRQEKAEAQRLLEEKRREEEEHQRILEQKRQEEEEAKTRRILEEKQRKEAEIKVKVAPLLDQFQGNEKKAIVFFKIRQIVAEWLEIDDEDINTWDIIEDERESLRTIDILMEVEEEFEIKIPEEEADQQLGYGWRFKYLLDNLLNLVYEKLGVEEFHNEEEEKACFVLDDKQREEAELRAKRISLLEQLEGDEKKFDLFLELRQIISEEGGIEQEDIHLNSHLSHNLGFDDLDAIELIMEIEELFKVEISSDDLKQLGIYWAYGWTFSSEPRDNYHQGKLCLVCELLEWLYSKLLDKYVA